MRGQVGAIQKSPTLATDASMLQGKTHSTHSWR
jgi:hypothetical protein